MAISRGYRKRVLSFDGSDWKENYLDYFADLAGVGIEPDFDGWQIS